MLVVAISETGQVKPETVIVVLKKYDAIPLPRAAREEIGQLANRTVGKYGSGLAFLLPENLYKKELIDFEQELAGTGFKVLAKSVCARMFAD